MAVLYQTGSLEGWLMDRTGDDSRCGTRQSKVDGPLHSTGGKDSCRSLGAVESTYTFVGTESWVEIVRSHQDELGVVPLFSEMPNCAPNDLGADSARIAERDRQTLRGHKSFGRSAPAEANVDVHLTSQLLHHTLGESLTL